MVINGCIYHLKYTMMSIILFNFLGEKKLKLSFEEAKKHFKFLGKKEFLGVVIWETYECIFCGTTINEVPGSVVKRWEHFRKHIYEKEIT